PETERGRGTDPERCINAISNAKGTNLAFVGTSRDHVEPAFEHPVPLTVETRCQSLPQKFTAASGVGLSAWRLCPYGWNYQQPKAIEPVFQTEPDSFSP